MSKTAQLLEKRYADRLDPTVRNKGIWNEGADGWWASLKSGWRCSFTGAGSCHEHTLKNLEQALRGAKFKEEWKEE